MPTSFSRFLSEEEMRRVRELYMKSLQDADADQSTPGDDQPPLDAPAGPEPGR
jgi:hypothetical protein